LRLLSNLCLIVLLAVLIPVVSAASEFEVRPVLTDQISCASETVLYILEVHNTGTATESYTVRLSGSASKWAVAAPGGFMLAPGKSESVYVYVTPSIFALGGDYSIDVSIAGQLTTSQNLKLNLEVSDCHAATLQSSRDSAEVCSATPATYDLVLENTGRFRENFELSLLGNGAKYATLSDEIVTLNAGQSKNIQVFANPVGNAVGDFIITATAKSQNSRATASKKLLLKSNACYNYDITLDTNFISTCENSEVRIPVTVRNTGTADNTYNVIVAGPRWAHAENSVLTIPSGSVGQTEIILVPEFGVKGTFDVDVRVKDSLGETVESQKISAKVDACHTFDLKVERTQDNLCPFASKTYEVSLVNTGKFAENYAIEAIGADFASVDRSFVELQQGQSTKLNLIIDPAGARAGNYKIRVKAQAQSQSQSSNSEVLDLTVADMSACFGVQATSALTTIEVVAGEGALVPIIIENKGTETSSYNLEVSGSGATYAKLNPASITVESRKSKTVYMYVSVPDQTPQENYKITVSARLQDGTVSSSTNVNVLVMPVDTSVSSIPDKVPRDEFANFLSNSFDNAKKIRAAVIAKLITFQQSLPEVRAPFKEEKGEETTEEQIQTAEKVIPERNESEETEENNTIAEEINTTEGLGSLEVQEVNLPGLELPKINLPNISAITEFFRAPAEIIQIIKDRRASQPANEESRPILSLPSLPDFKKLDFSSAVAVFDNANNKFYVAKDKLVGFAGKETYNVNNTTWMGAILLVLIAITMLFGIGRTGKDEASDSHSATSERKNIWQSFVDFLEEDDEDQKTEAEIKPEVRSTDTPDPIKERNLDEAVQRWRETPEVFPDKIEDKPKTKRAVKKPKKNKTTKKKDN